MRKLLFAAVATVAFAPVAFGEEMEPPAGPVLKNVYGQNHRSVTRNDVFDVDGAYLGTDPDPQVRLQILRDSQIPSE
jgi:hypothetical protein